MIPFVGEEQLNGELFTFVKKEKKMGNWEFSLTKSWSRSLSHDMRGEERRQHTGKEKSKEKSL